MEPSERRLSRTRPRPRQLPWVLVVAIFAALAVTGPVKMAAKRTEPSPYGAEGSSVKMAGLTFSPGTLTVPRGTEVIFDNDDVAPHTVTGDSAGATDSGILGPGKSFRLVVNERFLYHCAIHPSMKATIEILG